MLRFGMPSLTEAETVEQWAQICVKNDLQFVELNMNFPQCQLPALDADELNALAEKYGIFFTVHLDDNLNVADFNSYVAQAYQKTVLETIEIAKKANIPVLNMHLNRGAVYTLPERKLYFFEEFEEEYLSNILAFRNACEEAIGCSNVRICVENTTGYLPFMQKAAALLIESPVFALTYDIGHNLCTGGMDEPWILENEKELRHMHMHDAKAPTKDHLALGTGDLDIPYYRELARKHDCTVVLETKTLKALSESVAWLKEKTLFAE